MLEIDSEKVIEKAGYGIIFEGVWGTTRLPVAVKRMQLIHVLGKKQEESWLGLSHDNVVKLFHAESDSKFRYSVSTKHYDWNQVIVNLNKDIMRWNCAKHRWIRSF
jgi:hypothetical protein